VRSLLLLSRPSPLAAKLTPLAAFSTFSLVGSKSLLRQSRLSLKSQNLAYLVRSSPRIIRPLRPSHEYSWPACSVASTHTRGFFSSDGPRPSLSEVLSLMKLKVPSSHIRSSRSNSYCCRQHTMVLCLLVAPLRL
jgi:hypothetical protein